MKKLQDQTVSILVSKDPKAGISNRDDFDLYMSRDGLHTTLISIVMARNNFISELLVGFHQGRNQDFVSGVAVSVDGRTFRISRHCHSVTGLLLKGL